MLLDLYPAWAEGIEENKDLEDQECRTSLGEGR